MITNRWHFSEDEVEKKSKTVEELIKKNDLTLKYDFLKDYK